MNCREPLPEDEFRETLLKLLPLLGALEVLDD